MGELQKRLRKLDNSKDIWANEHIDIDEVLEIVGLMTKEFPKPYDIPNKYWSLHMEEIFKWRKKWLMPTAEKSKVAEKEEVK